MADWRNQRHESSPVRSHAPSWVCDAAHAPSACGGAHGRSAALRGAAGQRGRAGGDAARAAFSDSRLLPDDARRLRPARRARDRASASCWWTCCCRFTRSATRDEAVNEWLASHRSPGSTTPRTSGRSIGDIPFIPALVILTALGAALLRRWHMFAFIVGAIAVEVATYRVTSLVVHRQRPSVPRLDPEHLPVNQSYPSGHVAASVVVYVGLALLISSRVRDRAAPDPGLGARDRAPARSSRCRACTAACTIRSTRLSASSWGLRHLRSRCSPCERPAKPRGPARAGLPTGAGMTRVAVIAHRGKTVGGGLPELRRVLEQRGVTDVFWREVGKSRFAPPEVEEGARGQGRTDLRLGRRRDGAALRRRGRRHGRDRWPSFPRAPRTCWRPTSASRRTSRQAVDIGLPASRRRIDVGRLNGERFAVMAGAGFDARMIGDADGGLKDRFGRLAYVWTGAKNMREKPFRAQDQGRRRALVRRRRELHPARQRRQALRRRRGVRGRTSGRRRARARRRLGRRRQGMGGYRRAGRRRDGQQVAARVHDQGAFRRASSSIARCSTRSTAATARRCASCASTSSRRPCRSACRPALDGERASAGRRCQVALVEHLERPAVARAPGALRRIVSVARRSSRSSTATELSNVTGETSCQLDVGPPDARAARERARRGRRRRAC